MTPIPAQIAKFRSLINGYKISQILMTLENLGVFNAIGGGLNDINEIAERTGVSTGRLSPLLNAMVHYELLIKNDDRYDFTDDAVVLNPCHPASQNGYIRFSEDVRDKWLSLKHLVREEVTGDLEKVTGGNIEETRNFISAMHVNALPQSKYIIENYDFQDHKVLDLGAGSGVFSIAIANKYNSSSGVLFDLPGVTEITKEYFAKSDIGERFSVVAGDYHKEVPEGQFDDILLFAVAHQEAPSDLEALLSVAKSKLREGGRLFLTSFFLKDDKTGPTFPALFAVEMIVMHENGYVYTFSEMEDALSNAGFSFERVDAIPGPATLYVAS